MTSEAVNRRLVLVVTVHAEPHGQADGPPGNGALVDRTVAGGALDFLADVGCMIETHVGRRRVAVDALPDEVLTALAHRRELLDAGPVGGNRVVADHAGADTRQPRHRAGADRFVAVLGAGDLLAGVDVVRKLERLLRLGAPGEEL